ncbi:hypothetical protein GYA28_02870 [Candidatus Roizmanbacteria bacterium]|nr:hypothetical protein [Candidatus Roizmanbacteria bacterium]
MKKGLLVFFVLVVFFLYLKPIFADDNSRQQELQRQIEEYSAKLTDIRKQKNTLSSQIQYMDTQIYLTQLKIQETEQNIERTQKEIDVLGERIDGLDTSMNYYTKLLLSKVVENYKNKSISFYSAVLDSDTVNDFFNRFKYIKITQQNNQKLLIQVQQTKLNFEEQKKIREQKKIDLDNLMITLDKQKVDLKNQQNAKKNLLAITNNDENIYQNLLSQAQAQLAAFKSFTQTAGGGIIGANGFGSGSDGWYYSQRDARWANSRIGNSGENILDVGCLLTSVAMVLKKYGVDTNPSNIASNSNYFYLNTAFMNYRWNMNPWPNGLNSYNLSVSQIDDEIKNGRPVIVGIRAGYYGMHFVVLKSIDGSDYIMHDPYYGPDKKFSEHYSKGQIFSAETFK